MLIAFCWHFKSSSFIIIVHFTSSRIISLLVLNLICFMRKLPLPYTLIRTEKCRAYIGLHIYSGIYTEIERPQRRALHACRDCRLPKVPALIGHVPGVRSNKVADFERLPISANIFLGDFMTANILRSSNMHCKNWIVRIKFATRQLLYFTTNPEHVATISCEIINCTNDVIFHRWYTTIFTVNNKTKQFFQFLFSTEFVWDFSK
jgi:hypothetical protein